MRHKKVLMCGSELNVKGGMVSVIKNYLEYNDWGDYDITYIPTHTEKGKIQVTLYYLVALIRIFVSVIVRHYDIAYFHTAERGSFYRKAFLVRIMQAFGIKTVMHHHAAEFDKFYAQLSDKNKVFVNRTLEMVDLNIVLSNRLISMIKDKVPNARVQVLYNAVSTFKENPYRRSARNILFLGRLGERKGVYDLLKAIQILDSKLPEDIRFYLCGDGEIEEVKQKVKKGGIGHRIEHVGWIFENQKDEFLGNTMINILPSYNEGLPMSILETMARGIPNISTNIASIPEVIINDENGYLITPGDVNDMVDKILLLSSNENKRYELGVKAWESVCERFSMVAHIKQLKQYLEELVEF